LCLPHLTDAAAPGLPGLVSKPLENGGRQWSLQLQTLVFLTALVFLPAILLMMTGFTRIVIVLGLLRTAIGTRPAPPNQVLLGLALFLTFFVMAPTVHKAYQSAWVPLSQDKIDFKQALETGSKPFHRFMMSQTREGDLALFAKLAHVEPMQGPKDVPMRVLVPAFVTSELKTAFQIGFTIFIPFL